MKWIAENAEWIFSGSGVALFGFIGGCIPYILRFFYKKFKKGDHIVHSSNSYFTYVCDGPEHLQLHSRRIVLIHSFSNKKLHVSYPINTEGKILKIFSITDPGIMKQIAPSSISGLNQIEIHAQKNHNYVIGSGSTRRLDPFAPMLEPNQNLNMLTLFKERLQDHNRGYVGSRVLNNTNLHSISIQFDPCFLPKRVKAIQISNQGEILRDERSCDFLLAADMGSGFASVSLLNPENDSTLFLWWEWPTTKQTSFNESTTTD